MKKKSQYICNQCGNVTQKWAGQCSACGSWNCIEEDTSEISAAPKSLAASGHRGRQIEMVSLQFDQNHVTPRLKTGMNEVDRVTGGGIVTGSAILIGGDPGIGKSTLLMQIAGSLTKTTPTARILYITGEESVDQVRLRAHRLNVTQESISLASATSVGDIQETVRAMKPKPDLIIIDSIQTMYVNHIESAPGTVTQVRAASHELIRMAKTENVATILVGHVTKDGQIAGPRVLEHMVDTVLYFEGERSHQFRILRSVKNRFGATDEIGVFEMSSDGLIEVANPSALFLAQRQSNSAGNAVLAALEGTRPVLVEVQALVASSGLGNPRRQVIGWDYNRLNMLLAVLESRCGLRFADRDVYLNIAGGIKITEPAADLAVAAALISAQTGVPVPSGSVYFGEIGLSGEIRSIAQPDIRLKEAAKLGFDRACLPAPIKKDNKAQKQGDIELEYYKHIHDVLAYFASRAVG
jgi:DNA repair protein RadA/Sms